MILWTSQASLAILEALACACCPRLLKWKPNFQHILMHDSPFALWFIFMCSTSGLQSPVLRKNTSKTNDFFRGSYLSKGKERAMQHKLTSVTHGLSQKTNKREPSSRREGSSSAERGKEPEPSLCPASCAHSVCVLCLWYISICTGHLFVSLL